MKNATPAVRTARDLCPQSQSVTTPPPKNPENAGDEEDKETCRWLYLYPTALKKISQLKLEWNPKCQEIGKRITILEIRVSVYCGYKSKSWPRYGRCRTSKPCSPCRSPRESAPPTCCGQATPWALTDRGRCPAGPTVASVTRPPLQPCQ